MADIVGAMRERLVILQNLWPTLAVSSLTRSGSTATAVTESAHNYTTTDYVLIAGATPSAYNGTVKVTVVDAVTFTYPVAGAPSSPATGGAITAQYQHDAQSGRRSNWVTLDTIWAEMNPVAGSERLQVAAVQSINGYTFRVRLRTDLSPKMRVQWTPRWPPRAPMQTLEINSVAPMDDGLRFLLLSCAGVSN